MSFDLILQKIVDECGGGLSAALMGNDGIPISQVTARGVAEGEGVEDIGIAGVEFGRILDEVRKASDSLEGGPVRECVFSLGRFSLVVHAVDAEFFLAVALRPDGNLGKARYLIRRHMIAIREEL